MDTATICSGPYFKDIAVVERLASSKASRAGISRMAAGARDCIPLRTSWRVSVLAFCRMQAEALRDFTGPCQSHTDGPDGHSQVTDSGPK